MNRLFLSQSRFILGVAVLTILGVFSSLMVHHLAKQNVLETNSANLSSQAAIRVGILERGFSSGLAHVEFLASTPPIQGLIRASQNDGFDERDKTPYVFWKNRLEIIFSAYLSANSSIAQIRYIGYEDKGRELVRVDRKHNKAFVVGAGDLQRKAHRDYFKATQKLQAGQLYVSAVNLNRELGQVEHPPWPTYRIATPIYDDHGDFFGIVIVNFDAQILLTSIARSADSALEIFLINEQGHYLIHPQKSRAFAFEFGDKSGWYDEKGIKSTATGGATGDTRAPKPLKNFFMLSDKEKYWYSLDTLALDSALNIPRLSVIAAVNDSVINRQVRKRQFLAISIITALVLFAILLLYFYRKFSQKTLSEIKLKAEFEAIVSGTSDAVISTDVHGAIHSWNQSALKMFRRLDNDMYKLKLVQLFARSSTIERIDQSFNDLLSKRQISSFDVELNIPDEEPRYLSLALSPIFLDSLNISGFAAIFHDVTQSRELQASLERLNEQLENRNSEMERFIYTVSHDLKSPLVTIGGFSRRVLDSLGEGLDEKNRHRLGRIMYNVDQMAALLDELLNISRVIQEELKTADCDVEDCVNEACEALNQLLTSSAAEVRVDANIPTICANRRLFVQCLQNLIENAVTYRDASTTPAIQVSYVGLTKFDCVSIKDNGIGIDPCNHDQIFRIFERLDMGTGNGVGLAIVKTVMDKHKGKITVESNLGQGSAFTLCFPARNERDRNESNEST